MCDAAAELAGSDAKQASSVTPASAGGGTTSGWKSLNHPSVQAPPFQLAGRPSASNLSQLEADELRRVA